MTCILSGAPREVHPCFATGTTDTIRSCNLSVSSYNKTWNNWPAYAHYRNTNCNQMTDKLHACWIQAEDQCFFFGQNIGYVTPTIICFHYLEKTISGSKYPKINKFFENRSSAEDIPLPTATIVERWYP